MKKPEFELLASKVRAIRSHCASAHGADRPLTSRQFDILIFELGDFCKQLDKSSGFNLTMFREACKK